MNKKQKAVLYIFAVILLGVLLFPPFHIDQGENGDFNTGYSFILMPSKNDFSMIDANALLVEYLFIATIGAALFLAFKDKQ